MEVNQSWTFWLLEFFKYLLLYSIEERKSYSFGTTWGWENDDWIFIFWWSIPFLHGYYKEKQSRSERYVNWSPCLFSVNNKGQLDQRLVLCKISKQILVLYFHIISCLVVCVNSINHSCMSIDNCSDVHATVQCNTFDIFYDCMLYIQSSYHPGLCQRKWWTVLSFSTNPTWVMQVALYWELVLLHSIPSLY